MRVIPAVDLREGACVQLVGGAYEAERVRLPDAAAVVASWRALGFPLVHVVDLDAATGSGTNLALVRRLVERFPGAVQVGGGVRTTERIGDLLAAGAARVVVGTRALSDPLWLRDVAQRYPERVVVAADVRDGVLLTHGWRRAAGGALEPLVDELSSLPLAGLLLTAVHAEGRLEGPDLALVDAVMARARVPVLASGGVTTAADLAALAARGVAGCIIGMALYTGVLDPATISEEYRR